MLYSHRFNNPVPLMKSQRSLTEAVLIFFGSVNDFEVSKLLEVSFLLPNWHTYFQPDFSLSFFVCFAFFL
jgi:hypothetical protein